MKAQRFIGLDNPVVRDHRVLGQHLLPGLAYIDLLFQVFRKHGYDYRSLELQKVAIYQPLIVSKEHNVLLDIQCTEAEGGRWRIAVEGRVQRAAGGIEGAKRYLTAEMQQVAAVKFDESIDIAKIVQSATDALAMQSLYAGYRELELVHGAFMQATGQVYVTEAAVHAKCAVGAAAEASAEELMFHPTLLDGSALCGSSALAPRNGGQARQLALPLFYESFRACELLQKNCTMRIQRASIKQTQELSYCTLEFFNDAGRKVAELKNFASKLIRDPALIDPIRAAGPQVKHEATVQKLQRSVPSWQADMELFLRQLLADKLQQPLDHIDPMVGYYELGIQSAGLLELVQAIEEKIGATLSPTVLFEYVTIAQLSAYLMDHYSDKLAAADVKVEYAAEQLMGGLSEEIAVAESLEQMTIPSPIARTVTVGAAGEGVAIIGMAGRFPAATNIQELWENLKAGKDCVTEIPLSRWDWHRFETLRSPSGKCLSRWGGFIADVDCFDAQFFRISPREAESLDPQERLFLETSWEAIEDAGYTPATLVSARGVSARRAVGVFAGVMHRDYALIANEAQSAGYSVGVAQSNASIANRVSYYCNFHGPSMVIDTVCSSSLIAVHLASQSLRMGECEVALAGGVNLSLHPAKYLTYSMMDMFASDGRCHTFGMGGDGYVSSEAVGAVLLKPLTQAVADCDHIYAVIKSSGTNHVGTVSGFTVPSPLAQADLIVSCLEQAQIDPRSISYVEAHGTGTSLGDPIEMAGLSKAFSQFTQDTQFCAIGSIKSNIGHAESAAGLCGLIKVALQLHHRTLVPSLHSRELNLHIDWQRTPFFVQQKYQPWRRPTVMEGGSEVSYPRRAALSSFGATGANAHMILEEFTDMAAGYMGSSRLGDHLSLIVPLSARTEACLRKYAERLAAFLGNGAAEVVNEAGLCADRREFSLGNIAYTLQVGRKAMDTRVAFTADSIAILIGKLAAFARGEKQVEGCYYKEVADRHNATLAADEDYAALLRTWTRKKKLTNIAQAWVAGSDIDWHQLYVGHRPSRTSLPTYPFAKEKYWLVKNTAVRLTSIARPDGMRGHLLHPLLHVNTSDLDEQRFSSVFNGEEFFLRDHKMDGHSLLPGVCYLEMARAAIELSAKSSNSCARLMLQNVAWMRPLVVNDDKAVHIGLSNDDSGGIAFEIFTNGGTVDGVQEEISLAQGRGTWIVRTVGEQILEPLNLSALRGQCDRSIDIAQCDAAFREAGLVHGPAHCGVANIQVGTDIDGQRFVLAEVQLPDCVHEAQEGYFLHPSVLDGALQASIGLFLDQKASGEEGEPSSPNFFPFALAEMEIVLKTPEQCLVYCRRSAASVRDQNPPKLDIDICDEHGRLCVRMKGFAGRERDECQVLALPENRQVVEKRINSATQSVGAIGTESGATVLDETHPSSDWGRGELQAQTIHYLKQLLSFVLKLSADRIESTTEWDRYGIDSIMAMAIANELEKVFGSLPKTLLFEYQSIDALAEYFVDAHSERLITHLMRIDAAPALASASTNMTKTAMAMSRRRSRRRARTSQSQHPSVHATRGNAGFDIAIIGVSGRYPGANTIDELWENLKAGKDCITEIPASRWDHAQYFDPEKGKVGKTCSNWGGFIDLEPATERESPPVMLAPMLLAPEGRLISQVVENLLTTSGFDTGDLLRRFENSVGMYIGAMSGACGALPPSAVANGLSSILGIRGPSIAIDTMSASSLAALHMACEGLIRGDCGAAIVGGIHILQASDYEVMSQMSMLGSAASSRSFSNGDGLIPAEAIVAVMLVPMSKIIPSEDNVLAVIRSTTINHAGTSSPSMRALCGVIEDGFAKAGIEPRSIGYVEAGANGSPLADAIEVRALSKVFLEGGAATESCPIGSVKSNIGHAVGASGLTQLTKAVLQLMHKQIVPSVFTDSINRDIQFADSAFFLNASLASWSGQNDGAVDRRVQCPRRTIVNSIGAGGTYVSVILEEPSNQQINDHAHGNSESKSHKADDGESLLDDKSVLRPPSVPKAAALHAEEIEL